MVQRVFFLLLFLSQVTRAQNWQQLNNFPGPGRDDGSVFIIGNNVYCGLGNAAGIGPAADFHRFDPLTDSWSPTGVTSLPALGRQYCCSFSHNTDGFIVGGVDANWNATNEVWKYDTISNSWMQKTSMPDSLFGSTCFFINNRAYICGGRDQNNQGSKKVWEYDVINNSWLQKNDMPAFRWRASGAVLSGKGYLLFGADTSGNFSNKLYEYDAGNDNWTLIDSFPGQGRTYTSACEVNGFLFVAFGIDSLNSVYNDCYLYDVNTKQWINQNALPSFGRKGSMSFSFNGSVYITAGIDAASNRTAETWKAANVNNIAQLADNVELRIYPNPVNDVLHVEVQGTMEIWNMLGERVMHINEKQVNVNELPNGIYFIKAQAEKGLFTQKFVVTH